MAFALSLLCNDRNHPRPAVTQLDQHGNPPTPVTQLPSFVTGAMIETKFKLRPLRNLHPPPPSVTTLAPNGNGHSRYDRYRQLTITSSCVTEGGYAPSAVTAARRLKGRHRWTEACNGNGYTGATKRAGGDELPKAASGGHLPKRARGLPNPSSDVTVLTEQPTSTGHCLLRDFALLRQVRGVTTACNHHM